MEWRGTQANRSMKHLVRGVDTRPGVAVILPDNHVCVGHSVVSDFVTPWMVAHQAPLSLGATGSAPVSNLIIALSAARSAPTQLPVIP